MTEMTIQPDTARLVEENYDALEVVMCGDHVSLLQVTEDGESETVVIGIAQARKLATILGATWL